MFIPTPDVIDERIATAHRDAAQRRRVRAARRARSRTAHHAVADLPRIATAALEQARNRTSRGLIRLGERLAPPCPTC